MKNFSEETKERIITLCRASCMDTEIVSYLFPEDGFSVDKQILFYEFYTSFNKGNFYLSDDERAAILWYPPNSKFVVPAFSELLKDFSHFMAIGIKNVSKLLTYDSWLVGYKKRLLKDEEYCYLEIFAMDTADMDNKELKRNSSSDDLILPIIEEAKKRSCYVYTETFTENNLPFFGEYGFKLFHKNILPGTELTQYHLRLDI